MKRLFFLTLMALLATSQCVFATEWTAPVPVTQSELITDEPLYLYNIGTAQFLTRGGSWGTHAAIGATGLAFTLSDEGEGLYRLRFVDSGKYMFREADVEIYTDFQKNGSTYWKIMNQGNGIYHFATEAGTFGNKTISCDTYLMGWDPAQTDYDAQSKKTLETNIHVYMLDPDAEEASAFCYDWQFVAPDNYTFYQARRALYEALVAAEEAGVPVGPAGAVYTNPDATAEELTTAAEILQEAILNNEYGNATADNPLNVTRFIQNPDFEGKNIDGWDTNGFAIDPNGKVYTNEEDEENVVTISHFAEKWVKSSADAIATLDDYYLRQSIADLPAGKYILHADVIAVNQGTEGEEIKGAQLYMSNESMTKITSCQTENNIPQHFTVEFIHDGQNSLTMGVRTLHTNANWMAVDNFQLWYHGPSEINSYEVALQAVVEELQMMVEDDENYIFSAATREVADAALLEGLTLLEGSASDEAYQDMTMRLKDMVAQVEAEINAYKQLAGLCKQIQADRQKYEVLTQLTTALDDLYNDYLEAYETGTYDIDQINAVVENYPSYILELLSAEFQNATVDHPVDITSLFYNMGFETNTDSLWVHESATGNWTVRAHVAEVYNSTFDCYRDIVCMPDGSPLPKGKYIIRTRAFFRAGKTDQAIAGYNDGTNAILAHFYCNDYVTTLPDIGEGISKTQYSGYVKCSGGYVPNSMEAAEIAFGLNDAYQKELHVILMEEGDMLHLGFNCEGDILNASWSIFDGVEILYAGSDMNAIYRQEITRLYEELKNIEEEAAVVMAAADMMNEAFETAGAVDSQTSVEALQEVIEQLAATLDYCKESISLMNQLADVYLMYDENLKIMVPLKSHPYLDLLNEVGKALDSKFSDNESVETMIRRIKEEYPAFVQAPVLAMECSESNPGDITYAIYNYSFDDYGLFEGGSANGWNITYSGNKPASGADAYESYNSNSFQICQTLKGLAAGYYQVRCKAFYRPGSANDAEAAFEANDETQLHALLFATTESDTWATRVGNIAHRGNGTEALNEGSGEVTVTRGEQTIYLPNTMAAGNAYFDYTEEDLYTNATTFELKEGETVTLGLRKETGIKNDWLLFDDFQFFYLGTTAPVDVRDIPKNSIRGTDKTEIYSLDGRRIARMQRGINIVRIQNADGTTSIRKELVR